jgi:soluble cytochrome b562
MSLMSSRRQKGLFLAGLALAVTLGGCPLTRPKSVDCGALRQNVETIDAELAVLSSTDPTKATVDDFEEWNAALEAARSLFHPTDTMVHDDVKAAANEYKAALDALAAAIGAAKGGAADTEAIAGALRSLEQKRHVIDQRCPKGP